MTNTEFPLLLRAEEVARRLSIGRSKVFGMIADGTLPVIRMGRSVRVPEQALRQWVERQTNDQDKGHWHA